MSGGRIGRQGRPMPEIVLVFGKSRPPQSAPPARDTNSQVHLARGSRLASTVHHRTLARGPGVPSRADRARCEAPGRTDVTAGMVRTDGTTSPHHRCATRVILFATSEPGAELTMVDTSLEAMTRRRGVRPACNSRCVRRPVQRNSMWTSRRVRSPTCPARHAQKNSRFIRCMPPSVISTRPIFSPSSSTNTRPSGMGGV